MSRRRGAGEVWGPGKWGGERALLSDEVTKHRLTYIELPPRPLAADYDPLFKEAEKLLVGHFGNNIIVKESLNSVSAFSSAFSGKYEQCRAALLCCGHTVASAAVVAPIQDTKEGKTVALQVF